MGLFSGGDERIVTRLLKVQIQYCEKVIPRILFIFIGLTAFLMYAIVDIETTGGYAANNAITEVAIVLHDGKKETRRFASLVKPCMPIPSYVQTLTGITDEMVQHAPLFDSLAPQIFEMLRDVIFVAHNVNFDYSFIKHQLKAAGFELNVKKLCTVRLSRKVFPGLPGYSLGKLCRELDIQLSNRHRAGGDADATTRLFELILQTDTQGQMQAMLKGKSTEQYLPIHLPAQQLDHLPMVPGVYYFHDEKGKVIYVGKAKNIRKRVCSHFSNNKPNRQKQEFLRNIYSISHQVTGTELIAYLFECIEIKRLWPLYNRSLKRFEYSYGLYSFLDANGYLRLAIEKRKKQLPPVYTFSLLAEGQNLLRKLARTFQLCPKLCFMQHDSEPCYGIKEKFCSGACAKTEDTGSYNDRVVQALRSLKKELPSFALVDEGRHSAEQSCILMEEGRFYGMGYFPSDALIREPVELKEYITPYPENDYMRGLIYQHAAKWPSKKTIIPAEV